MSIFVFTDSKCSLYVYQTKFLLLEKIEHILLLHTIQNVVFLILSTSFFFSDLSYCLLKLITNKSSHLHVMLSMLCFHFRIYLTFVKAVTLILKHATLLRTLNEPEGALTKADLNYQKANIDQSIQQYLMACASELSVEQFTSFIMGTDIGLFFILPFVTSILLSFSVISALTRVLSQYRFIDETVN